MIDNFNIFRVIPVLWVTLMLSAPLASAGSNEEQRVELPAQPLQQSLVELGAAYGVTIVSKGGLTSNKEGPAVSGRYTIDDALAVLLAASNLEARRTSAGTLVVEERSSSTGAARLNRSSTSTNSGAESRRPTVIEQIVVTGQQIDRTLQQTKESVALVTARTIERRSLFEIEDVLLQSANVAISDPGSSNVAIRGVSRIPFAIGGVGDTSTTFYDDVAITNQGIAFISQNLWDVEQVELLRGPQSTNLGRNALIGALVVRSRNPSLERFEAAGRVELGNFDTNNLEAMVNIPMSSRTALRITGERSRTDGFIDNVTLGTDDDSRRDFTTVRAKLLTEFSSAFRATASLQFLEGDLANQSYIAQADGPLDTYESSANIRPLNTFDGYLGSLNFEYTMSDSWSFQSITAFSNADSDSENDQDGTERDEGSSRFPSSQTNWSQELRASFEGAKLRGIVGGYYLDDQVDSRFIVSGRINPALVGVPQPLLPFYPPLLFFTQDTGSDVETTNLALFTQWEYSISDRLTVSAGFRYDRESFDALTSGQTALDAATPLPDPVQAGLLADAQQPGSGAFVEGGVAAVNGALNAQLGSFTEGQDTTFEAFLPEVGVTLELAPDVQASFFYKRGYRAGGARLDASGALNEFDPEFLENFELSLRSEWLDNRLMLNANAYYANWVDQQVNVPIDGNQFNTRTENSGESRIWGLEAEGVYRPTGNTELFASVGYASTEFIEFCSLSSTAVGLSDCERDGVLGKDLSGNEFGVSPDWTAAIGGQQYLTSRIYAQLNLTYQAGSFGDAENGTNLRVDGFLLANASIGFEGDAFDVRLFARNLFDEFYETKRFNGQLARELGAVQELPRVLSQVAH
ncbi:MAG: TonB-dependent receptor [Pseudomonadota bacterium]